MLSLEGSHKLKLGAEELGELDGVISLDLEAAAPIGAPKAEGRYDDVSSNPQSGSNGVQVRLSIGLFSQEVKHSSVVPHVDLFGQAQASGIRGEPTHAISAISQALPGHLQGGLGNVRHYYIAVALIQEPVDEKRRSSSDVSDRALLGRRNCADQV